jgi:TrmH family RNA methyltransferase
MISLLKLERLPRHQRLRKILKIISRAEAEAGTETGYGEAGAAFPPGTETRSNTELAGIAELLAADPGFPPAASELLRQSRRTLRTADRAETRRTLNAIRHLLLAETGKAPADWDLLDRAGKPDPAKRRIFPGMHLYLEDLRSPFNVGSIFRSAESFGVEKIILSPLCADPRHPRALRSAMGCIDLVSWERGPLSPAQELPLFALETGGTSLDSFTFPQRGVMLIGSEELGLSPRALQEAGNSLGRLTIPTYGAKGSLNVAAALSIALAAWSGAQIKFLAL